jgi:hypothetical protein
MRLVSLLPSLRVQTSPSISFAPNVNVPTLQLPSLDVKAELEAFFKIRDDKQAKSRSVSLMDKSDN